MKTSDETQTANFRSRSEFTKSPRGIGLPFFDKLENGAQFYTFLQCWKIRESYFNPLNFIQVAGSVLQIGPFSSVLQTLERLGHLSSKFSKSL